MERPERPTPPPAEPIPAEPTPPTQPLQIRVGFDLLLRCQRPTPMIVILGVHDSRAGDLLEADPLQLSPQVPCQSYVDTYGNHCNRLLAPAGPMRLRGRGLVADSGLPDPVLPWLEQQPVELLPDHALLFLLASRFCESDLLTDFAWSQFGQAPEGWGRVQAICDFVHQHVRFDYNRSSPTKSALQTFESRVGVCRDFAHLAIALCRSMNIPARYCTGYLSDIEVPPPHTAMDFSAWFEAYLGQGWHVFDPRNNTPRIGRILIARGRDAADVALTTSFGPSVLESFEVWAA
jgi:transglutaminase-like putative cysteine protease